MQRLLFIFVHFLAQYQKQRMKDNQNIEAHILEKYQILKKLGSGAYGHVWKAKDKKTGSIVALKKIFDAFQHSTDAQRTFREISILKQLKNDKIIKLQDTLASENNQDIYIVFQYMESDLYHLVYQGKLQPVHIKYIMYQVLLGLQYLHNSKLIHRDLKPSNILVNSDCSAKICDFGLVRYLGSDFVSSNMLTEGVATRWYRAPEVLLGSNEYNTQADMWSIGCILAEIMLKNPLFPGTCTTNQLERILQLTGQPSTADIKSIKAQLGQVMISEVVNGKIRKKLDILAKIQDKVAIDLIYKLLEFNPSKRLTAQQALKHQYFADFFNPSDVDTKGEHITLQIDENIQLQPNQYLNIIKDKFVSNRKPRTDSQNKDRRRVSQSPKSFSDLKKPRLSAKKQETNSISKTKLKAETPVEPSINNRLFAGKDTNLFKELCEQKQKSLKKKETRGGSKENIPGSQNSLKKETKPTHEQPYCNFQSFSAAGSNLKKYGDQKKFGSFCGLKKTSKLNQK